MRHSILIIFLLCGICGKSHSAFSQSFQKVDGSGIPALGNAQIDWLDYNSDGNIDIIISGNDERGMAIFDVYQNKGNNTFSAVGLPVAALKSSRFLLDDFNNDNRVDILYTGRDLNNQPSTILLENNGSNFNIKSSNLPAIKNASLSAIDFNQNGKVDILISGQDANNDIITELWTNSGDDFTKSTLQFPQVFNGSWAVVDFDKDGYDDIVISGETSIGNFRTILFYNEFGKALRESNNSILNNLLIKNIEITDFNQNGNLELFIFGRDGFFEPFVKLMEYNDGNFADLNISLPALSSVVSQSIDSDNDGDRDILLFGLSSGSQYEGSLYVNDGNANFANSGVSVGTLANGGITVSDLNNDGASDFTYSGFTDIDPASSIVQSLYLNENITNNTTPEIPNGLSSISIGDSVKLEWNVSSDDLTSSNTIHYNVYVGTAPGKTDIISPVSGLSVNQLLSNRINRISNTLEILTSLEEGEYFWSVQAIDNAGNVSAFAAEESFSSCYKPDLGPDLEKCKLDIVNLSIGTEDDVVNWYSKTDGLLLADSNNFDYIVLQSDTIIAEVNKPFGCTVSDTVFIKMLDLPSEFLPNKIQKCEQETVEFGIGLPGQIVNWYSAESGLMFADQDSISFQVNSSDTLIAEIINENNCSILDSVIIEKFDLPTQVSKIDTTICEKSELEWSIVGDFKEVQWHSANDGLVAENINTFSAIYNQTDTLFISKTNTNNCTVEDTVVINTRPLPTVDLGEDLQVCIGDSVDISLNEGNWSSIQWESAKSGILNTNTSQFNWFVDETDTINVMATDNFGCINYDTLIIRKLDLPQYDIGSDTVVCKGSEILLSVEEEFDIVNWYSTSTGILKRDSQFLEFVANDSDTIWSEVINSNGCVAFDTLVVKSVEPKKYDLGKDLTQCFGDLVSISVQNLTDSINWYLGDSLVNYHGDNLQFEAENSGSISIETINYLGCISYDSLKLLVNELPLKQLPGKIEKCENEVVEFKLNLPDHTVNWFSSQNGLLYSDVDSISFLLNQSDTLIAEIINENNCSVLDSVIIKKLELPIQVSKIDTTICEQSQFKWSINGDFKEVYWHSANEGFLAENINSLSRIYNQTDTLFISKTNDSNCTVEDTVVINTRPLPIVDLGEDLQICEGDSIEIKLNQGNWDYIEWESAIQGNLQSQSTSLNWYVSETDTIRVVASDNFGCFNTDTIIIEKLDLPEYDIGSDTILCQGSEILLTTGTGFEEVNWYSSSAGQLRADNWFLEYVANQTDTVWSEVYNSNGCIVYDSIVITANEPIQYSLGEDFEICKGELVNLTIENLQDSINWYFDNSLLEIHTSEIEFDAESSLTISIETFDSLGCTSFDELELTVNELPQLDLPEILEACKGKELVIKNTETYDFMKWESSLLGLIAENVNEISYFMAVSDTIFLTAMDEKKCINYDTVIIHPNTLPEFSLGPDIQICEGNPVQLEIDNPADSINWFNNLGVQLLDTSAILNVNVNQNVIWWAEQWNASSCIFSDTIKITNIPLPIFDAGDSILICEDAEVQLTPSGINESWTLEWSPAEFLSDAAIKNPIANPTEHTWFYLFAKNNEGCFYEDSVFVALDKPVVLNTGGDRTICLGDYTELGGLPTAEGSSFNYQYQWSPAESLSSPSVANPIANPAENTTYQLITWAGDCKADTAEVTVYVQVPPEIILTSDTTIGAGDQIQLQALGGDFYQWIPARGLSDASISNPLASPVRTTTYLVEVTDSLGCRSEKEMTVFVENQLFIPNLFTPNNDGQNDFFKVYGAGIKEIEFKVFTRNGQVIYSTNSVEEVYKVGWDGNYNGNPVESGVYVWSIKGQYFDERTLSFKGKNSGLINLMR
ncbi:FG-GAP-like repeat-containing protein [Marivirga sp.]|uniref:FG-GAP-like repeat-containing protein n=1 Tax=Marivirga sp. TaxID=2018662 RepID=UPI002D7F8BBB|nr:FG-GAP-like repeat-containing protein [Marivirga sp.]HET8858815.1 FG-GAP-like repeat-containing protein [Marivirga sp.]